jgi:hypothetical protein
MATFAVMRGKMKGRAFDSSSADILATYKLDGEDGRLQGDWDVLYRDLTAKHATKEAPAVYWQRNRQT